MYIASHQINATNIAIGHHIAIKAHFINQNHVIIEGITNHNVHKTVIIQVTHKASFSN
jgi:hypothetical protein